MWCTWCSSSSLCPGGAEVDWGVERRHQTTGSACGCLFFYPRTGSDPAYPRPSRDRPADMPRRVAGGGGRGREVRCRWAHEGKLKRRSMGNWKHALVILMLPGIDLFDGSQPRGAGSLYRDPVTATSMHMALHKATLCPEAVICAFHSKSLSHHGQREGSHHRRRRHFRPWYGRPAQTTPGPRELYNLREIGESGGDVVAQSLPSMCLRYSEPLLLVQLRHETRLVQHVSRPR